MAAGLGFKTFTTGEVLTAADTNGYLMQGVLVFASSAARAAAITSPQEGQYSYLKDTNSTEYYDGAAWIAAPIGDITGVTAGTGISGGGTSGTVTVTNSMATEIAAKGDLIVGTGAATFDNLTVGANGTTLVADSTASTGLKWAAAASGSTFVGCLASTRATQTLSNNTMTAIALATEIYDTDGFHSTVTNNSRFTIPTGKGGSYLFFATGGTDYYTGGLGIRFAKNGTNFSSAYFGFGAPASGLFVGGLTTVMSLTAGDYVELILIQNSGSNKAVAYSGTEDFTFMGCTYLGA